MAEGRSRPKLMVRTERNVAVRDFMIFQIKLLLDGAKDGVLIVASLVAILLDVISGKGKRPRLLYSVMRVSERFDLWINLNGAIKKLDAGETDDGLFGASEAGSHNLITKIEQLVRGKGEPAPGAEADPTEPAD